VHRFTVRFTANAGPNPFSAVLCSRNSPHDLRNDRNDFQKRNTHTYIYTRTTCTMPKKKGKFGESKGSIKFLVGSLEVEEGSMVQGPSSSQPRDVQYRFLLDVLHSNSVFLDPWDRKSLLIVFEQLGNNERAAQEHQRFKPSSLFVFVSLPPAAELCAAVGNLQYPLLNPLTNLS
jgi:hypothetical protein